MRGFQRILLELKDLVKRHKPGDELEPPRSLLKAEIFGRRLAYLAAGLENREGCPPVVLLHGFGGFFMDWPRIMAQVSRHTSVYALDLPGWGFSEPNPMARSLEDDVNVVDEFIRVLGLNEVILCGLSYGAGVAWASAALRPLKLKHVVLLNPMPPHPIRFMASPLYRGIFFLNSFERAGAWGHRLLTKSQYKTICRENLLNHRLLDSFYLDLAFLVIKQPKILSMLRGHAQGARDTDWNAWEHRLSGVRVPVTILQGREDRIFSLESARFIQRLIPNSELIEVEKCGHAIVFDQHKKVSDHLIKLVSAEKAESIPAIN